MKSITIGKWVGWLGVAAGALGLLSQFLQANVFAPYAITAFAMGILQLVIAYLANSEVVALKAKLSK